MREKNVGYSKNQGKTKKYSLENVLETSNR